MLPDGSISILSSMGEVFTDNKWKKQYSWNRRRQTKIRSSHNKREMVTAGNPSVMFETVPIYGNASNFIEF
jgi:hypothetical protein